MKILIIPKGQNPYQELLYSYLQTEHPSDTFSYLKSSRFTFFFFPLLFLIYRLRGYKIIHIHWLVFHISHRMPMAKIFSYYYTIFCLSVTKFLGYKVVWTVHETTTHDNWTINDIGVSRKLSRIAAAKIAHSVFAVREMEEAQLDISRTYVIPHGNYIDVYPDSITSAQARKKLDLKPEEITVLFFGAIRPYKGVEKLLDVLEEINDRRIRVIIAGRCRDDTVANKIYQLQKKIKIDFYEDHIEDADVATYFKACDVVCLPFKKITTSGSAILALSFGKPVITTRTGALRDFPENVGYFYNPENPKGLKESLSLAIRKKSELKVRGVNAKKYADTLSWDKIAKKTYIVYENVLNEG